MFRRLFGLCEHKWTKWSVRNSFISESHGIVKIVQQRECRVCGKTQIDTQSNY